MARLVHEKNTKVYFVPLLDDVEEPTITELTGGTNLSPFIAKDGVVTPSNQNMVDSATIETNFDAQQVGSWGGPVTLTCFRDDTTDTAYELIEYGLKGYLVIARQSPNGVEIGDPVEVYPVEAHQPVMSQTAANEMQKFTAQFAVTSEPALAAEVAGS